MSSRSKPPNSPFWSRFNSLSKSPEAADLKAKQEAETKTAADKAAADKRRADKTRADIAAAELKAKQYAEAAANLAATKKTIMICVKGKLTKKVMAFQPKCPSGYKLQK